MLKNALLRPLGCLPHARILTRNSHQPISGVYLPLRTLRTSIVLRDERRVEDAAKSVSSGLNSSPSTEEAKTPRSPLDSLTAAVPFDLEALKTRFRELSWQSAATVRQRADEFTAKTAKSFSQLGAHLNKVTGYEEIEALKKRVVEQEARITATRQAARDAKKAYDEAVLQRSVSQREVNDLLQRKSGWNDHDVSRFTTLVRQEHLYEQEEVLAKTTVVSAEDAVDREFSELMRTILARYHEEQVWSDKIRSASTYGSLAALALNLLVFISATILIEPWKRRRMAQAFEKKTEEMNVANSAMVEAGMKDIALRLEEQEMMLKEMMETASKQAVEMLPSVPSATTNTTVMETAKPLRDKMLEVMEDREVVAALAACSIVAGGIGWCVRVLLS